MKVISTEKELKTVLDAARKAKKTIGFVPTMGALHAGHLSLVEAAKKQTKFVVASVFVNPNQFNDKKDFERYPRTPEKDVKMLKEAGADVVFIPDEKTVYPQPDKRKFSFGKLDQMLEAKQRPGHFNGVAQVVSRFLDLIHPDKLFLGQKDYQQTLVIRELIKQINSNAEVVVCPIVRDAEQVALSSRNTLLSAEEYDEATFIPIWMDEVKKLATRYKVSQIKARVETLVSQRKMMNLEYFEICDSETLDPVKEFSDADECIALIAIRIGKIRLIDNMIL